jgi:Arc/MetJ family transcription regulator
MRTNVEIDDELMRQAMRASGAPTKRAAVELGLTSSRPASRCRRESRRTGVGLSGMTNRTLSGP